jgi:hypothetical protein
MDILARFVKLEIAYIDRVINFEGFGFSFRAIFFEDYILEW